MFTELLYSSIQQSLQMLLFREAALQPLEGKLVASPGFDLTTLRV